VRRKLWPGDTAWTRTTPSSKETQACLKLLLHNRQYGVTEPKPAAAVSLQCVFMDKIGNWLRLWSGDDQLGVAADAPADAIMAGPGENVPPMYLRLNTYTDRTETVMREGRGSAFGARLLWSPMFISARSDRL
jgi:hypothetical protein